MDIFAAALPGCPRLGAKHMRALIEAFGTAEDVWKASDKEIVESHLLKGKTKASFLAYRKETEPEEIGEKLYRLQIHCVTWEDDLYPPLLRTTANPPAVLFYKGNDPVFEKTVAIVGSRKAMPYGVQTAERIACGLAENGVTVVSGGARGIDSAAHEGALRGESPTVVVLACGLDHVYPPENKNLFQKVIDNGGAIISEYPPGNPCGRGGRTERCSYYLRLRIGRRTGRLFRSGKYLARFEQGDESSHTEWGDLLYVLRRYPF